MLLSGYFLVESPFRVKRLLKLLLQIWFYIIGIGMVAAALGYVHPEGSLSYWLTLLCFPVSAQHYWFMSVYVFAFVYSCHVTGNKKVEQKAEQKAISSNNFLANFYVFHN